MYNIISLARNKWIVALAAGIVMSTIIMIVPAFGQSCSTDANCSLGKKCLAGQCSTDFGVSKVDTEVKGVLGTQDLTKTVAGIINVALSLLGIVAVIIILIGGFQWMTAGGNEEKVEGARNLIFAGIIGLAIILSAWAIARFVLRSLSQATGSGTVTENALP